MNHMNNSRQGIEALEYHPPTVERRGRGQAFVVAVVVLMLCMGPSWGGPPNPTESDNQGNTAGGSSALESNEGGRNNTAFGDRALTSNTIGNFNTAVGHHALVNNATGSSNTAVGVDALVNNTTGSRNTAVGDRALSFNTTGSGNTASGLGALAKNTTGFGHTAVGDRALSSNTTGSSNTAVGANALVNNTTGTFNIAIGVVAGEQLTSGTGNIYLGHGGGTATESDTMRLGQSQTRTFITGIRGVPVSGIPVRVSSTGQLGIQPSSARYKRDIQEMGSRSQELFQLRPVTFRYQHDPQGPRQYGLIAEEVVTVYPELVTWGADGHVETVHYDQLIPLLLNELQHQQQKLGAQAQQLTVQAQQLAELKAENESLRTALVQQHAELAARLARLEEGLTRAATPVDR